MHVATFNNRCR